MAIAFVPAIAIAPPPPPVGDTWYVDGVNGSLSGDGSAGDPFEKITSAIATASPGDTILVKPGYYDDEKFPLMPFDGLTIKGVNGSDETTIDAGWDNAVFRVWDAYDVTIEGLSIVRGDAMIGGGIGVRGASLTVKDCFFSENIALMGGAIDARNPGRFKSEDPEFSFDEVMRYPTEVVVDGCTFYRNGWLPFEDLKKPVEGDLFAGAIEPTMPPYPDDYEPEDIYTLGGGGVNSVLTSMTVTGSTFEDNVSWATGGGLRATHSQVTVAGSVFDDNAAWNPMVMGASKELDVDALAEKVPEPAITMGGGAFLSEGLYDVSDTDFTGNVAHLGAGLFVDAMSKTDITDCSVNENRALVGGGIVHTFPELIWCLTDYIFNYNTQIADMSAAQIAPEQFVLGLASQPDIMAFDLPQPMEGDMFTIRRTEMVGNGSDLAIPAMLSISWPYYMENCLIAESYGLGAAVASIDLNFSCIDENQPGSFINHTTFAHNATGVTTLVMLDLESLFGSFETDAQAAPACFDHPYSTGTVLNSIFWNNDYCFLDYMEVPEEFKNDIWGPNPYYCDLQYGAHAENQLEFEVPLMAGMGVIGEGNISEDPQWMDPVSGDYTLTFGSPCVDTATPIGPPVPDDIAKGFRPLDGDLDGFATPDMGCFELEARDPGTTERVFGENRFGTAVEVSQDYFPTADTVMIARADVFADALACAGLAGYYNAPILLTNTDSLPGETAGEIARLGATSAIILGGPNAVSPAVMAELEGMGLDVQRIGGADRYDTAGLLIDELALVTGETTPSVMFIARGDLWADALAVSPVAFALQAPTMLVKPDALPPRTVDVLQQSAPLSTIIVGGKNAVSTHVAKSITMAAATSTTDRISGYDRYATAAAMAEFAVAQGWSRWDVTGLATGTHYADALTGGAGIGRVDGVLLLTDPTTLSNVTRTTLTNRADDITRLDVLGGPAALSSTVKSEAALIVQ